MLHLFSIFVHLILNFFCSAFRRKYPIFVENLLPVNELYLFQKRMVMSEIRQSEDHHKIVSTSFEVTVKVGLALGLIFLCFLILKPFFMITLWGVIIAVSMHPLFLSLAKLIRNRKPLSAVIITIILLFVIITPIVILGASLVDAVLWIKTSIETKQSILPPLSAEVQSWPLIGSYLYTAWQDAYANLRGFASQHSEQLIEGLKVLLKSISGAGFNVILFLASIIISGALLIFADRAEPVSYDIAERLMGRLGRTVVDESTITVRNVIRGILGVAFIQSVMAGLGFMVAGVPGAGLWAFIAFFLCLIQVGPILVMIPVLIFVFMKMSLLTFILLAVWCVPILLIDNVLKPILLGRKAPAPMLVVFLGAIGGFLYFGIIGLFVGSVILSLGYKLFLVWLYGSSSTIQESNPQS